MSIGVLRQAQHYGKEYAFLKSDHCHAAFGVTRACSFAARCSLDYFCEIVLIQRNVWRTRTVLHRRTALASGDRHDVVALCQQPGERNLRGTDAMLRRDALYYFDNREAIDLSIEDDRRLVESLRSQTPSKLAATLLRESATRNTLSRSTARVRCRVSPAGLILSFFR